MKLASLAVLLSVVAVPVSARPYYAAKKGLSCSACHVAPAGGGMRNVYDGATGKINDNLALGADLRAFFSQTDNSGTSSFSVPRSAVYVSADPRPDTRVVYNMDNGVTSQVFGIWRSQGALPFYVRGGRFWLPYGIQWDDMDNSAYTRIGAFVPNVGFDMSQAAADTGVEVGLAPKKDYFVNLALTNGQPNGTADNNVRKAVTARAGYIAKNFMVGGSAYTDKSGPTAFHATQTRYGPMAWVSAGKAALIYEGGFGTNKPNAGGSTDLTAHLAELTVEPKDGWLAKARFETLDPDTSLSGDDVQRYSLGLERIIQAMSFELALRTVKEKPKVKNDQVLFQTHIWF